MRLYLLIDFICCDVQFIFPGIPRDQTYQEQGQNFFKRSTTFCYLLKGSISSTGMFPLFIPRKGYYAPPISRIHFFPLIEILHTCSCCTNLDTAFRSNYLIIFAEHCSHILLLLLEFSPENYARGGILVLFVKRGRASFQGYLFQTVTESWVLFSQFSDISQFLGNFS